MLKLAGLGGAAVAAGGWVYGTFFSPGTPAAGKVLLTAEEFAIVEAMADAFFPGPPTSPLTAAEVRLADFADDYLGNTMYEQEQRLFKLMFRAFDLNAKLVHRRGFATLALAERQALLGAWWNSKLDTRRAGYQSLRWLFSMGYFENFGVRKALGLDFGCDLSSRFPELLGVKGVE